MIDPFNNVAIAGESLIMTCLALPQEGIGGNVTVTWTGNGTSLLSEENSGSIIFLSPVKTSHAGEYTCTVRHNIPDAGVDVTETNTTSISIQCS